MGRITDAYDQLIADGSIEDDAAQRGVLPEFDRLADALEKAPSKKGLGAMLFGSKPDPIPGLYVWGGVGRGKSMLMDLFHDTMVIEGTRRVHFHAFMQDVQARLHKARQSGTKDALKPVADDLARGLRLLCLDEMQITDIADAMIVGRLFEALLADGIAVVTTSNRVPDDLYKDGLNRALFLPFIDLLKTKMVVHELTSPRDYRQDRLQGEQTYFHPADSAARAAIDGIWDDLSSGMTEPLVLTVNAREVTIPQFSSGVGRASFYELCGAALGPADYLAIADALRVLILEDIPRLSAENYNQARRFVTLIDALYEARVRLIASATDIPERLYIEGEGSFEFERTASRLREMQSDGWGKN
jgi:cell division protein ZapE